MIEQIIQYIEEIEQSQIRMVVELINYFGSMLIGFGLAVVLLV